MTEPLHAVRFPGESEEFRLARDELLAAEIELRRHSEAVAAQRRSLPLGGEAPTDYGFQEIDAERGTQAVRLSELFAEGKDTLVLYSFMFIADESGNPLGVACPACTSIIDALDGQAPHLTQRINLATVAKVPIEQFRRHADTRGWEHIRLLSAAESTYKRDYHCETPEGSQRPIANVFVRREGRIHHSWSSELAFASADPGEHPRHVDFMWPLWNVLDLTPEGRGEGWHPRLSYE
jgi:predicted dithiol-disulfide oxidoreductase (DUF899 family)